MLIAQRRLIISDPSGDIEVPVRLFLPEEDDGMWICRYEIDWPSGREAYFAAGVDGMQALILALQVIGVEVYRSDYHKAGMLRWFEPDQGYGFPIVSSFRDVLIGDDARRCSSALVSIILLVAMHPVEQAWARLAQEPAPTLP